MSTPFDALKAALADQTTANLQHPHILPCSDELRAKVPR
jgi:hypothetical protein